MSGSAASIMPKWLTEPTKHEISPWMKWSAGALVLLSIVLIAMYWQTLGDADAGLYGFWKVDGAFAERANLDSMYIYIGAPKNDASRSLGILGASLPIYIFLKAEGEVRHNGVVPASMARRTLRTDSIQKYTVDFGSPVSIIPRNVSAEYDTVTQMLVLRGPSTVYARLFKEPETSFYCTAASMAGMAEDNADKDNTEYDHTEDDEEPTEEAEDGEGEEN